MDISKYELDGTWLEIAVESTREVESFRFKVQPIGSAAYMAADKSEDSITALCVEAVIGWNLTLGTDPIPCTSGEKGRYLARFATYVVKTVNGVVPEEKKSLAAAILEFASKPDNFLKN